MYVPSTDGIREIDIPLLPAPSDSEYEYILKPILPARLDAEYAIILLDNDVEQLNSKSSSHLRRFSYSRCQESFSR